MSRGISQFEDFWRQMKFAPGEPYVHPDDKIALTARDVQIMGLNLPPIPVNGNLRSSDVVILMLNPGYSDLDALRGNAFSKEIQLASEWANLHQRDWPNEYPMFDLNPDLVDSGGAEYWAGPLGRMKGKLGHLAHSLAAPEEHSHSHIRKELANRIAVVQLVAYRSTAFADLQTNQKKSGPPQLRLKSSEEARKLARALVEEGEKLVVIPYGIQHWGYAKPVQTERLVVYKRGLREAHIAPTSAGYHAVLERLRISRPL